MGVLFTGYIVKCRGPSQSKLPNCVFAHIFLTSSPVLEGGVSINVNMHSKYVVHTK